MSFLLSETEVFWLARRLAFAPLAGQGVFAGPVGSTEAETAPGGDDDQGGPVVQARPVRKQLRNRVRLTKNVGYTGDAMPGHARIDA